MYYSKYRTGEEANANLMLSSATMNIQDSCQIHANNLKGP